MKVFLVAAFLLTASGAFAQDAAVLIKEAENLERQLKEPDALEKYKQVLTVQPTNLKALVKAAELNASISSRQTDKNSKRLYVETAYSFAKRAWAADSTQADAGYAMAMASGKMTEVETENRKLVAYVKDIRNYADKALAINPNHAKANYTLGKWHYEMANLSGIKKTAVKLFYGGLPEGNLEDAEKYMEKCRALEPYFAPNFLDLAKAYKDDHKPAQAIEVLNRLVKLPIRSFDDSAAKAEGARLLAEMQ